MKRKTDDDFLWSAYGCTSPKAPPEHEGGGNALKINMHPSCVVTDYCRQVAPDTQ